LYEVSELEFVCRGRQTDAVRRPAARPFVQDAQSAMRLAENPSKRSRDRLSGSCMALWASRTNGLAAGRRPASRSRGRDKHTKGQFIQCIRRRAITYLVVATPTHRPFCLLQRRSRLASLPARGVAKWHNVDRRCTCYGCVGCSEVAYRRNIYAGLNRALGLDDVELLSLKQIGLT